MLTKIFLLVAIIAFVWFGWRWLARVQAIGRGRLSGQSGAAGPGASAPAAGPASTGAPSPRGGAEDMEKCPECGAYVAPRMAGPCGRPGCPYGR